MPDLEAYNSTSFDWDRIRAYAARVARTTTMPCNPPWRYNATEVVRTVQAPATRGFLGLGAREEKVSFTNRSVETTIFGEYWIIDTRSWHRTETTRSSSVRVEENDGADYIYALLRTGELKVGILQTNEVWNYTAQGGASLVVHPNSTHMIQDLDDRYASTLDFEKKWRDGSSSGRPTFSWGDRDPGKRLIRHAKGVGLNLALKNILEGRAQS